MLRKNMQTNRQRRKERVALLSVASNTCLTGMKLAVGLMIGSVSILSEAIHSGMDLLAAGIAFFSVKTSSLPADRRHPFGHGKIENISGAVEALLIFGAAIWIIVEALRKFQTHEPMDNIGWGVGVMLASTVVNMVVSRRLFKVGREEDSIALIADGWHLRADVYTSAGVMVSLILIWAASWLWPGVDVGWLDPLAAMIVAVLILKTAVQLTARSIRDLLDVELPGEELDWIHRAIRNYRPPVHGFHQMRTRKSGPFRFIDFHIKVNPDMSVQDSHDVTVSLSRTITDRYPGASVTIHVEPCDGRCEGRCLAGCLLEEKQRQAVRKGETKRTGKPSVG